MTRTAQAILGALMWRGIGHTHTLRTGTDANDCIVIAHNKKYAKEIAGSNGIALSDCDQKLYGVRKPIAIDNMALEVLLRGLLDEINEAYERGLKDAAERGRGYYGRRAGSSKIDEFP